MRILSCLFLLSLLCLTGCVKHYKNINGIRLEVLSPAEEDEMKSIARAVLNKNKKLTPQERALIKKQIPELKIRYTEDRAGEATVIWKLPGRQVMLRMRGAFFDPSAQWMMLIRNEQPEYLDLRRQQSPRVEKR